MCASASVRMFWSARYSPVRWKWQFFSISSFQTIACAHTLFYHTIVHNKKNQRTHLFTQSVHSRHAIDCRLLELYWMNEEKKKNGAGINRCVFSLFSSIEWACICLWDKVIALLLIWTTRKKRKQPKTLGDWHESSETVRLPWYTNVCFLHWNSMNGFSSSIGKYADLIMVVNCRLFALFWLF